MQKKYYIHDVTTGGTPGVFGAPAFDSPQEALAEIEQLLRRGGIKSASIRDNENVETMPWSEVQKRLSKKNSN